MYRDRYVSAVIPARDEEKAIAKVIGALIDLTHRGERVIDEIIVCDNDSRDKTFRVAVDSGASVVYQPRPGYGRACLTALHHVNSGTDFVLFVDGDDSCFVDQAITLLEALCNGVDLAIGSRQLGNIEVGALTPTQQFGNRLATNLIRRLWGATITDLGPFRAVKMRSLRKLRMRDQAFGWTVEMQVKAIQHGLVVKEYPVDSKVRIGRSKISGTVKGSILAGVGILSMIARLYIYQRYPKLQNRFRKIFSEQ